MTIPSLVFDIISLLLIVSCAAYYWRSGFVAAIISLLGTVISLVVAVIAAERLAPFLFDALLQQPLQTQVADTISQYGISNTGALLEKLLDFLPAFMLRGIEETLGETLNFAAPDVAGQVVKLVIAPLVTPLLQVLLFFILFGILRTVFRIVAGLAKKLAKMPVLGGANRTLGAVLGVPIGILYVYLACCMMWIYDFMRPDGPLLAQWFGNSVVFSLLGRFNFLQQLT